MFPKVPWVCGRYTSFRYVSSQLEQRCTVCYDVMLLKGELDSYTRVKSIKMLSNVGIPDGSVKNHKNKVQYICNKAVDDSIQQ